MAGFMSARFFLLTGAKKILRHLPVDDDDVGCTCVIESVGYLGIDATLITGKELD